MNTQIQPSDNQAASGASCLSGAPAASVGRDLRTLPKAELHLHFQAAMRPTTLAEMALEAGMEVPDMRRIETFEQFELTFRQAFRVTRARPGNVARMVRELVADAAADGVVWVQPHFDPRPYADGAPEEMMELVLAEGQAAGAEHGVGFGLTMGIARHRGPEAAEELVRLGARYADHGVVALGLTGNESAHPAEPYARAFAIAREAGLAAAPHAGELAGPESVRTAVDVLGATRIAHGIRAVEDPSLLDRLAEQGVSMDVCLTSNILLKVVPGLAEHPLRRLLDAGVHCSLGADDPLMFESSLSDEYLLARTGLGLTDHDLAAIARTSVETSGADRERIVAAVAGIDHWLAGVVGAPVS